MKITIITKNFIVVAKVWFVVMGSFFSLLSIILSFVSWEELGIKNVYCKVLAFVIIVVISLFMAVLWVCCIKRKNTIWESGNRKIVIRYGDIMKISFPKKEKGNRIVVIPVNTCFDTQVDEKLANQDKLLVSPNTIHGKWIKGMAEKGREKKTLDKAIENYIKMKGIKVVKEIDAKIKSRGKLKQYEIGEIAVIEGDNGVNFFLLALTDFDDNNNAQSSKESIIECLKKMLDFYNENGQGFEIYIPLVGTGMARCGLSHEEALQTIKAVLQLYSDKITGEVNVVIYSKDKEKVSIYS